MSPRSSDSPPHPPDLANRDIPVETIPSGTRLARIHHGKFDPIYFGSSDLGRFGDPRRIFGFCYLATTMAGAFAETFVRGASNGAQNHLFAQERSLAEIEVTLRSGYALFLDRIWRELARPALYRADLIESLETGRGRFTITLPFLTA